MIRLRSVPETYNSRIKAYDDTFLLRFFIYEDVHVWIITWTRSFARDEDESVLRIVFFFLDLSPLFRSCVLGDGVEMGLLERVGWLRATSPLHRLSECEAGVVA